MHPQNGFTDVFVAAQDGLRLHAHDYGPRSGRHLAVICLPGLTRTAADFHVLASHLSCDPVRPRRVLALDYRGRGLSDYDPDPNNYSVPVETADVIALAVACEAGPAVLVGTSRGGLIAMALAAARPSLVAGAVLNDIGPVIETAGLMRIKGYVGRTSAPRSFDEGAEMLRRLFAHQFTALAPAEWADMARRSWKIAEGALVPTYDVRLTRALAAFDADHPIPPLWPQFDALAELPLMVVRGENSDLLSAATVAAMRDRRRDMAELTVADQGHAPLLAEPGTLQRIADFIADCDRRRC